MGPCAKESINRRNGCAINRLVDKVRYLDRGLYRLEGL